ncbi:MAG: cupin domain-containing protein [Bacteroidota bacterium]
MRRGADYWITKLQLNAHIEGGAYTRTYSSDLIIPQSHLSTNFHGPRPVSTAIYFLLKKDQFSAMHRIASDELWHFYYGDPLIVYELDVAGNLTKHLLGNNPENNEHFQCLVKAGSWFGAAVKDGSAYSLAGCTVAPGFDFADFELGERNVLLKLYPQYAEIICQLTRTGNDPR